MHVPSFVSSRLVEATWDPELAAAMQARGLAVHEEQVVEQLLADLASRAGDAMPCDPESTAR